MFQLSFNSPITHYVDRELQSHQDEHVKINNKITNRESSLEMGYLTAVEEPRDEGARHASSLASESHLPMYDY